MENTKELLTVIIPVYNGEKFIEKNLNSVLNQTYTNIEIIIIDDGSTDNTRNIIETFLKKTNIKYIYTENKGVSNARNLGIKNSNGMYIAFLDSDDTIPKNYYDILINNCKEYKSDIVLCGMKKQYIDKSIIVDFNTKYKLLNKNEFATNFFILNQNALLMTVWNKLYKKEIIENIEFDTSMIMGEDYVFNLNVFSKCNTFSFAQNCLYGYIQNKSSVSYELNNKYSNVYELKNSLRYRKICNKKFQEIGIPQLEIDKFYEKKSANWFLKMITNLFLPGNTDSSETKKQKIREILEDVDNKKYLYKQKKRGIKENFVYWLYKINSVELIYWLFKKYKR